MLQGGNGKISSEKRYILVFRLEKKTRLMTLSFNFFCKRHAFHLIHKFIMTSKEKCYIQMKSRQTKQNLGTWSVFNEMH